MGRDSGPLLGVLLLLAVFLGRPRKLTASSFIPTFSAWGNGRSPITYSQYYHYATKAADELEEGESLEDVTGGRVLTINGRLPTPRGTTIPFPTRNIPGVRKVIELQPIEEAKEEPHFQDVAGRTSVNLRLKPI